MSDDSSVVRIFRHIKGSRASDGSFAMVKPGLYLAYDEGGGNALLIPMHENVYPDNDNALNVEIKNLPSHVKKKI